MEKQNTTSPAFDKLLDFLKQNRGFDFTGYKRASLERRILRRMQDSEIQDFDSYITKLEADPAEFTFLFNMILINVTAFFRDPETWQYLYNIILPKIIEQKSPAEQIRVWSAGVASGEEAYSIAILLAEHLGFEDFKQRVKIYATDMDDDALAKARAARYSQKEISDVPEHLREKYFESSGGAYYFHKELRRRVIYGQHNLIQHAPISRIDLLLCRNILMYFNVETQAKVLTRIHFSLNEQGYLFLGKAEMILSHGNLFTPVDIKHRVFRKVVRGIPNYRNVLISAQRNEVEKDNFVYVLPKIREVASDANPIAQIATDTNGTLVLANEQARSLFHLSINDIGRPLQDLKLSYQPVELRSLMDQAKNIKGLKELKDVPWNEGEINDRFFDISVVALYSEQNKLIGFSFSFNDVSQQCRLQRQAEHTNQELETAMEELESANEELETTNEELQSTIEELETTNEELQATNEELETMNEELHATNEELETLSNEMTSQSDEVNQMNAYLNSILSSLENCVIVINKDYLIEVWNPTAEDLWGVRKDEVLGQSFFGLDIGLPVEQLKRSIRDVTTGKNGHTTFNIDAINRRGQTIELSGSTTPLYNQDQEIKGVILIMDIRNSNQEEIRK